MKTAIVAICLTACCCVPGMGQSGASSDPQVHLPAQMEMPSKTAIYIDCTCEDMVGALYATALRDAIARSPRYSLASSPSEGSGKNLKYNWTLSIVSINDTAGSTGISTAISTVLNIGDIMFGQHIQSCGIDMVTSCAATTLASADNDLQNLKNRK